MAPASAASTLLASARIPLSSPGVNALPTEASPVGCVGRTSNRPASPLGLQFAATALRAARRAAGLDL